MTHPASVPEVRVITLDPSEVDAELLVVPVFGDSDVLSDVPRIDAAVGGEIGRARASAEFRPTARSVFVTPVTVENWPAGRIALVGVESRKGPTGQPSSHGDGGGGRRGATTARGACGCTASGRDAGVPGGPSGRRRTAAWRVRRPTVYGATRRRPAAHRAARGYRDRARRPASRGS